MRRGVLSTSHAKSEQQWSHPASQRAQHQHTQWADQTRAKKSQKGRALDKDDLGEKLSDATLDEPT